jgi:hypothetical protein
VKKSWAKTSTKTRKVPGGLSATTNLTTAEWCHRVAVINAGLVMYLKKKVMTEEELIKKIITVNCKLEFMWDFIRN